MNVGLLKVDTSTSVSSSWVKIGEFYAMISGTFTAVVIGSKTNTTSTLSVQIKKNGTVVDTISTPSTSMSVLLSGGTTPFAANAGDLITFEVRDSAAVANTYNCIFIGLDAESYTNPYLD